METRNDVPKVRLQERCKPECCYGGIFWASDRDMAERHNGLCPDCRVYPTFHTLTDDEADNAKIKFCPHCGHIFSIGEDEPKGYQGDWCCGSRDVQFCSADRYA